MVENVASGLGIVVEAMRKSHNCKVSISNAVYSLLERSLTQSVECTHT